MTTKTGKSSKPQRRIMRFPEVIAATGFCRASIYNMMKDGRFPKNHKIAGTNIKGWDSLEVEAWIAEQVGEVA